MQQSDVHGCCGRGWNELAGCSCAPKLVSQDASRRDYEIVIAGLTGIGALVRSGGSVELLKGQADGGVVYINLLKKIHCALVC